MSYARARLWLGISGVGLLVTLSMLALWFDVPGAWTPWIVVVYLFTQLPLDYLGGYRLPVRFGRRGAGPFWPRYLRGVLVHAGLMLLFAVLILQVGQRAGLGGVLGLQLLLMIAMVARQETLAEWVGGVPSNSQDPGFTGGIAGLPGSERLVIPDAWPAKAKEVAALRRSVAVQSGSRLRGLVLAMVWNLVGFAACAHLPGAGVTSAAELVRTLLGFVGWSFLGLLLLPTPSRWGVREVDWEARQRGLSVPDFVESARLLDRLQDDEPQRPAGIEAIFHPIPGVQNRIALFGRPSAPLGAWNAARYALFLAWPCLGLLSRAVHCNVGRPELWVFLPVE